MGAVLKGHKKWSLGQSFFVDSACIVRYNDITGCVKICPTRDEGGSHGRE